MVLAGLLGKAGQNVQFGKDAAVGLDVGNLLLDAGDEFPVKTRFNSVDAVFGRKNLLFVLLEFLGDVTLRVHQRLLTDPFRRHLVAEGVANFDIVTEYVVVGNLQRGDAGSFGLPLLHLQEVILASGGEAAQLIQFGVNARADNRALAHLDGGFRGHDAGNLRL